MNNQLQEYVLDLLTVEERTAVEREAARNETLRQALHREREVGRLVRHTLQETTAPAYGRLPQLMPAVPDRQRYFWPRPSWQRAAAALALVLVLFVGAFSLYQSQQAAITPAAPTLTAVTATFTHEPTATLAALETTNHYQTSASGRPLAVGYEQGTAVAQPGLPEIQATPAPPPGRVPIMSN